MIEYFDTHTLVAMYWRTTSKRLRAMIIATLEARAES